MRNTRNEKHRNARNTRTTRNTETGENKNRGVQVPPEAAYFSLKMTVLGELDLYCFESRMVWILHVLSGKSVWLVIRRSWVQIPAGSWGFSGSLIMTWHWCCVVFPSFRLFNNCLCGGGYSHRGHRIPLSLGSTAHRRLDLSCPGWRGYHLHELTGTADLVHHSRRPLSCLHL